MACWSLVLDYGWVSHKPMRDFGYVELLQIRQIGADKLPVDLVVCLVVRDLELPNPRMVQSLAGRDPLGGVVG